MRVKNYLNRIISYFREDFHAVDEEVEPHITYERTGQWEITAKATWSNQTTAYETLHLCAPGSSRGERLLNQD